VAPGWTARNAWSNQNLRVRVSVVWFFTATPIDTPTRPAAGSTV
jgi:hypothetical protein